MLDGVSYIIPNTLIENIEAFYEFVYEDADYVPSDAATEISQEIEDAVNGTSNDENSYKEEASK